MNSTCHVDMNITYNLKDFLRQDWPDLNYHARSAKFSGTAGVIFKIYDNPGGSTEDDWAEITLKQDVSNHRLQSLGNTFF